MTSSTVVDELRALEPIFHAASATEVFAARTAPEFWEVGASGSVYDRALLLKSIHDDDEIDASGDWDMQDFVARALTDDVWLVTYELTLDRDRRSRRSTVWRRTAEGWLAEYHQGTLL